MLQLTDEQLMQAAKQFGTPLYVYYSEKITEQYQKLTAAFAQSNVKIFYACKALTNINILKHLKFLGSNIDCCSINEVKLALHAGFKPNQILYTSNGVAFDEIKQAAKLGILINIDSLSNLKKFGQAYGNAYPVGIRLRPNIMAGGNLKISTGHDKSKFGIPVGQIDEILAVVKQYNLQIQGLHIHTGSDIKDADVFVQGIGVVFSIIPHFPQLQYIDLGGGLKVAYKNDDEITDINLLAKKVKEVFEANPIAKNLEIWFEPGKFLVSECGYLVTQVNVLKTTKTVTFAGINSGFNHLIRPMFYNAYHPIKNISNPTGKLKNYAVTGYICETDTFAWDREINEISEGDYLVLYNAGAYGFEMSSNFNSRLKPAEVMFKNNEIYLIRKREEFDDLLRNQTIA